MEQLEHRLDAQDKKLCEISDTLSEVRTALLGDMIGKQPGLHARVSTLERADAKRVALTTGAFIAGVGAACKALWDWLAHHPK